MTGIPTLALSPFMSGIQIIKSPFMEERVLIRMCRSKKKRIIKKWKKNPKNYHTKPMSHFVFDEINRTVTCHPTIAEKIVEAIGNKEKQCQQ